MRVSDVAAFFERMAVYWPKFENSESIFKTYCQMFQMENTTSGELLAVSEYLRREAKDYYPAPGAADVTRALKEIRSHTPGKKKRTPEEGWAILCDLAARGKTWDDVSKHLSERAKYAVRTIGGWEKIRLSPTEDLVFIRKDWLAAYSQMEVRDSKHESLEFSNSSEVSRLVNSTAKNLSSPSKQRNHLAPQNKANGIVELAVKEVGR